MEPGNFFTRRWFLLSSFATFLLSACGGKSDSEAPASTIVTGGNCLASGTTVTVGSDHGHTPAPTVPASDVLAGAQQVYNLPIAGAHGHTFTVTSANFTTLQGNTGVVITSSFDSGHSHAVTINCV